MRVSDVPKGVTLPAVGGTAVGIDPLPKPSKMVM
jgi:hypothetical protein